MWIGKEGKVGSAKESEGSKQAARKTPDRRVRKTRTLLRHCLAELLKEKPINEITVRELTDMSDLNRGTFYLHYRDVYDLLQQTEQELLRDFNSLLQKYDPEVMRKRPSAIFSDVFQLVSDNRDIVSILMGENGNLKFQNQLREMIRERCLKDLFDSYRGLDPESSAVFFQFILSGCIGVVQYWIKNGFQEDPRALAQTTEKIILNGIRILEQE